MIASCGGELVGHHPQARGTQRPCSRPHVTMAEDVGDWPIRRAASHAPYVVADVD